MTRVYVADALNEERSALCLLLLDLKMEVVGEAADWQTTLANAPDTHLDMLLVDWALLPTHSERQTFTTIRGLCLNAIVIVLLGQAGIHRQTALFTGANALISKDELPDRVADHLRWAAANVPVAL